MSNPAPVFASLASLPERVGLLRQTVGSLLPQVDGLRVFLNGYDGIPDFLNDPKIEIRHSQDWGDHGDAGKFSWAAEDAAAGRIVATVDDDIIYPPDYISRMVSALGKYDNRVVVGLHGALLRQPITNYYDADARVVLPYKYKLAEDRAVQLLGTGTVVYDASQLVLTPELFQHRNMADIWLALAAQRQEIPMVSVARPDFWLKDATLPPGEKVPTIWSESFYGNQSRFNTSMLQTAVLRQSEPLSVRLPEQMREEGKRRLVLGIKTYNRVDYVRACLESFMATADQSHAWAVIVADDGSTDGTREMLEKFRPSFPFELHVIHNERRFAIGQTNTIYELASRIGFDVGFAADDDVIFTKPGWEELYLNAIEKSGYEHLCHLDLTHWRDLRRRQKPDAVEQPTVFDPSGTCEAHVPYHEAGGHFWTFTPSLIAEIGGCDETEFFGRGYWHWDYSGRAARAGFNDADNFFDARGSNHFITIQNNVDTGYHCSLQWEDPVFVRARALEEKARRWDLVMNPNRHHVSMPAIHVRSGTGSTVNKVFDRVVVLNLKRRSDRLEAMTRRLARIGVEWERSEAVDGQDAEQKEAYNRYLARQQWLQVDPSRLPGAPTGSIDCSIGNHGEPIRARFIAERLDRPPIGTLGAWGYLRSMENILTSAIRDGVGSLLVLDDDCCFHNNFCELFARGMAAVPEDWGILKLGALQFDWDGPWNKAVGEYLYQCNGTSVGSHAVGVRADMIPLLLENCYDSWLPYDVGALNIAMRCFASRSMTFLPNLAIQDSGASDIRSSAHTDYQRLSGMCRWGLDDYSIDNSVPEAGLMESLGARISTAAVNAAATAVSILSPSSAHPQPAV